MGVGQASFVRMQKPKISTFISVTDRMLVYVYQRSLKVYAYNPDRRQSFA